MVGKLNEGISTKIMMMKMKTNQYKYQFQLPANFEVKWNVRLTKTAGYFSHKKRPINGDYSAGARIELSSKV